MNRPLAITLVILIATYLIAAVTHAGLIGSRTDPSAATAESIIAAVLIGGLAVAIVQPARERLAALASQGFALLGTLVGITLVLSLGPRTTFDVGMHLLMLALLGVGLSLAMRLPDRSM